MKKSVLFLLICLSCDLCISQPLMQKFIGGADYDSAAKVIATSDGGFACIGSTRSFGAGQSDMLFIKYDSLLNVQWARTYGSAGNDFGSACVQLSNGNYILGGTTFGLSIDTTYSDMLVISISSTGLVLWAKTAGSFKSEDVSDIALTSDSYLVVAGSTSSGFQPNTQSAYAMKFDLNGNMKWAISYPADSIGYFKSVTATAAGGVAFTGSGTQPGNTIYDVYVVKADSGGIPAWSKRFGGTDSDYSNGIINLSTSELLITGLTKSYGAGGWDAFLLKLDASGNSKWLTTYGTSNFEKGNSVIENEHGQYIFCGTMAGNSKGLMIKTDTSGTLMIRREYGDSNGNSITNSLVNTVDSGFVIVGNTESFGAQNGDIYLLKSDRILNTPCFQFGPTLTSNSYMPFDTTIGTYIAGGTSLYVTSQITTTAPSLFQNTICGSVGIYEPSVHTTKIFPNPVSEILNVELPENNFRNTTALIKSMNGQIIYSSKNFIDRIIKIPTTGFAPGLYFLQIFSEKEILTEKINIVK